jgi:hypothetical protein
MTERESYRDTDPAPVPSRRDVYRETAVDEAGAPLADAAARDVYQERVSGPATRWCGRSTSACPATPPAAARE